WDLFGATASVNKINDVCLETNQPAIRTYELLNSHVGQCNPDGKKLILFHDGDLTFQQPFNTSANPGFVIFVVNGNVTFEEAADEVNAMIIANGGFNTGTSTSKKLTTR